MILFEVKEAFLGLVRLGIGHHGAGIPLNVEWNTIENLAAEQGLSAILVDGLEKLPLEQKPPKPVLLQWIGEVLQGYEYRYEQYRKAIAGLAGFYNSHGFHMMVLKGYACSLDWPKPEHRPCGDIDIWLFGKQKEADKVLANTDFTNRTDEGSPDGSKSVKNPSQNHIGIDNSHHHHTVFRWQDFMVENHYDFVNVHAHRSSAEMEKVFKELGSFNVESGSLKVESLLKGCSVEGCKIPSVEVHGEKVYLPSANLHALFLIKHMVSHFAAANITLRQVLDWAFFVQAHTKEIDWKWLVDLLEKYHMRDFYCCLNAICVEDLGFPVNIFPSVQFEPRLKERVLEDILNPAFTAEEPKGLVRRLFYKYRRWQGNAWKQEMCYEESRWSAFWYGIWAKLLKPASI